MDCGDAGKLYRQWRAGPLTAGEGLSVLAEYHQPAMTEPALNRPAQLPPGTRSIVLTKVARRHPRGVMRAIEQTEQQAEQ